ncbi:MAG: hypothetical protein ABT940_08700 [Alphaproteobacteria bacterium]
MRGWHRLRSLVPTLILPYLMAACFSIPQPFRHDENSPLNPLVRPRSALGIIVRPAHGLSETAGTAIARQMAEALQTLEIPTVVGDDMPADQMRYVLQPLVYETRRTDNVALVTVVWTLKTGDILVAEESRSLRLPLAEWTTEPPSAAIRTTLIGETARHFAASLNENPGKTPPPPSLSKVAVTRVSGLSGEGDRALLAAMQASLRRAGLALASAAAADFKVTGTVTLEPIKDRKDEKHIVIHWNVTRADGSELGDVKQQNDIPASALSGSLAPLADAIAIGGAQGVADVIARVRRRQIDRMETRPEK